MDKDHSYAKYFHLRNKDPKNYVLYKDFYFYSILAIYVFFFWLISTVIMNTDTLKRTSAGTAVLVFNYIVLGGVGLLFLLGFLNRDTFPYSMAGIIFLLFIIELAVLLYHYDKRDLDSDYSKDPVSIAITFLLLYAFVSYFTC